MMDVTCNDPVTPVHTEQTKRYADGREKGHYPCPRLVLPEPLIRRLGASTPERSFVAGMSDRSS